MPVTTFYMTLIIIRMDTIILRFDFDLLSWFEENCMVLNAGKCHFIWLGMDKENESFTFNNFFFNYSYEEKILGIKFTTG